MVCIKEAPNLVAMDLTPREHGGGSLHWSDFTLERVWY